MFHGDLHFAFYVIIRSLKGWIPTTNGKNPEVYNYIGNDSALIIEKEIETEMKAELYSFLLDNKFNKGVMFKKSIEQFVEHYEMVGLVQEETLMRAFQRWRKLVKEEKAIKL